MHLKILSSIKRGTFSVIKLLFGVSQSLYALFVFKMWEPFASTNLTPREQWCCGTPPVTTRISGYKLMWMSGAPRGSRYQLYVLSTLIVISFCFHIFISVNLCSTDHIWWWSRKWLFRRHCYRRYFPQKWNVCFTNHCHDNPNGCNHCVLSWVSVETSITDGDYHKYNLESKVMDPPFLTSCDYFL